MLNNSDRRNQTNCPTKKIILIRKSSNILIKENKPKLSPDGRKPTTTIRIKRKTTLYTTHCLARLSDAIGMC